MEIILREVEYLFYEYFVDIQNKYSLTEDEMDSLFESNDDFFTVKYALNILVGNI